MKTYLSFALFLVTSSILSAQSVGINTDDPQAKLHVFGEGMVPEPGGLFLFGSKTAAHLVGDVNYLQSNWTDDGTALDFYLQPNGGDLGINLPANYPTRAPLHIHAEGVSPSTYGLFMLGDLDAGNLQIDFDRIQAQNDGTPQSLAIQPDGGDVELADGTMVIDHSKGTVGIGDPTPDASLDIISGGNTSATRALQIRSSTFGNLFNVRNDGHVGIGTSAPAHALHVIGDIGLYAKLVHHNDDDTYLQMSTDKITMNAGGKEMLDITESDGQDIIFLGNGDNVDLRMNGNALHVEGTNDWVGVGTSSPDSKLHVVGSITMDNYIIHQNDSDTWEYFGNDQIWLHAGGFQGMKIVEGASDYVAIADGTMIVDRTERGVGIGVTTPEAELHIHNDLNGGIILENNYGNKWMLHNDVPTDNLYLFHNGNYRGGFDDTDGDYNSTSDRRLKKNISDLGSVLDKVNSLSPKTYHFKTQENDETYNIGFVAQEVQQVFPEVVSYNASQDIYGLDYNDFGVISIQAIKELTEIVEIQQQQIDMLLAALENSNAENVGPEIPSTTGLSSKTED